MNSKIYRIIAKSNIYCHFAGVEHNNITTEKDFFSHINGFLIQHPDVIMKMIQEAPKNLDLDVLEISRIYSIKDKKHCIEILCDCQNLNMNTVMYHKRVIIHKSFYNFDEFTKSIHMLHNFGEKRIVNCTNCNYSNKIGEKICKYCGRELDKVNNISTVEEKDHEMKQIVILSIVIPLVFIVFFFLKRDQLVEYFIIAVVSIFVSKKVKYYNRKISIIGTILSILLCIMCIYTYITYFIII